MSVEKRNVVIIGAGPAGYAAGTLRRGGRSWTRCC